MGGRADGQAEIARILPTLNLRWTFSYHQTKYSEAWAVLGFNNLQISPIFTPTCPELPHPVLGLDQTVFKHRALCAWL